MTDYYTGIGSRDTPRHVCEFMTAIAKHYASLGYILRSGGAVGADTAFEAGATLKEIWLPKLGFNGNISRLLPTSAAFEMAEKFHPAWDKCNEMARKFHARNCHQVLGPDLKTPTKFVVCWTVDAKGGGGTGQAIRIAKAHKIPVYDLARPEMLNYFENILSNPLEFK